MAASPRPHITIGVGSTAPEGSGAHTGRIRTIKPEFWGHEALSQLPADTHMLAAALLNYADDEGYFNANERLVAASCCPLREFSVSIVDALSQLASAGYIRLGTGSDGRRYGHVVNFLEHQRINRPTPCKIKDLDIVWEGSVSPHGALSEPSLPEGKGKEGKGKERGSRTASRAVTPSEEFLKWYAEYPRHDGRGDAATAYAKALKKTDAATLLAGAKRAHTQYTGTEARFIPLPATWLNGERWLDEGVNAKPARYSVKNDPAYAGVDY